MKEFVWKDEKMFKELTLGQAKQFGYIRSAAPFPDGQATSIPSDWQLLKGIEVRDRKQPLKSCWEGRLVTCEKQSIMWSNFRRIG